MVTFSIIDSEKMQDNAFEAADFLKTLANSNRLVILSCLLQGEMCVGDLEKKLNISQSALSQHLSRMRAEGIVGTRRESQQIFYRIKDARVAKMLEVTYNLFCGNEASKVA
jgi:ArsR family transcriptional regulator